MLIFSKYKTKRKHAYPPKKNNKIKNNKLNKNNKIINNNIFSDIIFIEHEMKFLKHVVKYIKLYYSFIIYNT